MRNNSAPLQEKLERNRHNIDKLKVNWQTALPGTDPPSDHQLWLWLRLHNFDFTTIFFGFDQCAKRRLRGEMDGDHCVRYASGAMNRFKKGGKYTPLSLPERLFVSETENAAPNAAQREMEKAA